MRLAPIVLMLRAGETHFGNFIGGAAELGLAINNTLKKDMAFVIPLFEEAADNDSDPFINQMLTERYGVVVALGNDENRKDEFGIYAYDQLDTIRSQIIKIIVGYDPGRETITSYRGGKLLDINRAYLWYQFEFEFKSRLVLDSDGFGEIEETPRDDRLQRSQLPGLEKIYTNFILAPSADLPYTGDLPLDDGYPDVRLPDMASWIDLNDDPNLGGYGKGFASGFNLYKY